MGPGYGSLQFSGLDCLMAGLLERALLRSGDHCHIALDGSQALNLYRQYKDDIDVVLIDLGRASLSGTELIRINLSRLSLLTGN